jgi:hypothetical protein
VTESIAVLPGVLIAAGQLLADAERGEAAHAAA